MIMRKITEERLVINHKEVGSNGNVNIHIEVVSRPNSKEYEINKHGEYHRWLVDNGLI
jgi:hypothetical protein